MTPMNKSGSARCMDCPHERCGACPCICAPAEHDKPCARTRGYRTIVADPYVEMFARRARFGWDYYGDESLGTAEVAA